MKRFILGWLSVVGIFGLVAMPVAHAESTLDIKNVSGPSVTKVVEGRLHDSWPWYIIRASGIIAAISLAMLLLSGIGMITGLTYKLWPPLVAWASHRSLGIIFGISVLVHMGGLLFDHYAPFSLPQLLVPWLSDFKPVTLFGTKVGSLWVALGVIGFWLTLIVVVSSLLWIEKKPRSWKQLHFLSYIIMAVIFFHALLLGTDLQAGWTKAIWISAAIAIAILAARRAWRLWTT